VTDNLFGLDDNDLTPEPIEAVEGGGRLAARLPGGSGYLIIEGPGAGSVVSASTGSTVREAPALPDRDEALDGTRPLFLVHRSYNYAQALPRLLANVHAAAGANVCLGLSSSLPQISEESHVAIHSACAAAAVHIVDPLGYFATSGDLRLPELSDRTRRRAPYLAGAPATVSDILNFQRDRGANLLLTPGRALDPADPQRSLDAVCAEGDDALAALKPGERLALNLTMSARWLTHAPLRDRLLAQLLDQEQFDIWYTRVQWSASLRSYAQQTDEELLRGYQRLAELAVDENRRLLLPQTGLTGWFTLAYGTTGFGMGISGTDQAFREDSGGGGPAPVIERYFERQLLHTIERTSRPAVVSDPQYVQCTCPYCPPLFAGTAWSREYTGLHLLYNTGTLAAIAAPAVAGRSGPHGAIRRTVRSAVAFAAGKGLVDISEPRHLPVWDRLL
jgi:hypothetical protein